MNTFSSMGEAEGAAMAHNARMAADLARLTTVRAETTPEPSAMSVPLSDTRLAEIRNLDFLDGAITELDRSSAAVAATRTLLREVDRLRAELDAARAEPAQPSPEHQAIYLDDFDQVWCDYPTVPAGDDVLPLVWASEQAQSRTDLADGGNRLRVIGWCR